MGTISVFRVGDLSETQQKQLSVLLGEGWTGATEKDTTGWRKFINWIIRREIGDIFEITIRKIRNGKFHRKHMKLESVVFEHQERFTDFDQFRNWLKIGCGFVTWVAGPKGGIVPLPKSIAYDKCEQDEYEDFHGQVIEFFQSEHCQQYLWRHLKPDQQVEMMNTLIGSFVVGWDYIRHERQSRRAANDEGASEEKAAA